MLIFAVLAAGTASESSPGLSSGLGWIAGLPLAIPEASSLALLIVGLAAVGVALRRRHARLAASGAAGGDGLGSTPAGPADQQ